MFTYTSTGTVFGKLWGGGAAAYPAIDLKNKTKKGLLQEANQLLKTGGLDSGMGFEELIGAVLYIEAIETIVQNGKEYTRSSHTMHTIGHLTDKQVDFILKCNF